MECGTKAGRSTSDGLMNGQVVEGIVARVL